MFDDNTVFIALATNEKFPDDGIELDPNSKNNHNPTQFYYPTNDRHGPPECKPISIPTTLLLGLNVYFLS